MAEINVHKKDNKPNGGRNLWILLAVLVVAGLGIWALIDEDEELYEEEIGYEDATGPYEDAVVTEDGNTWNYAEEMEGEQVIYRDGAIFYDEEPEIYEETWENELSTTYPGVMEFARFARNDSEKPMGLEHEYTSEGLTHLSNAIEETAGELDTEQPEYFMATTEILDECATSLTQTPETATSHADYIRKAFASSTAALKTLQARNFPMLQDQIQELSQQADKVEAAKLATNQQKEVENYFDQASTILMEMHRRIEA